MPDKKCKRCGNELDETYTLVSETGELVAVYEAAQQAIILNKGDCLCDFCGRITTYYRRVK